MPIHKPMSEPNLPNSNRERRLNDDRGFMIIEVLVSALILIMASLAVFSALDNADKAAGNQQRRAQSANWAQSEMERIRSMPVEDIAAMKGVRTITRDGINYTITTSAKWISDGGDEPKCTSRTGGLDYMRVTVSIAWQKMGNTRPVTFTTLYTPPAGAGGDNGSLSVRLINRNAGPVAGVPVTLDGPVTMTETTNANGCVIFAFVPESLDYAIRFQRLGYVNQRSINNVADTPVTVTARETTKLEYLYDSGGFTLANFKTRSNGPTSTLVDSTPPAIQMFHIDQGPPEGITIPLSGTQNSWNGASVPWFPFTTPYSIYGGNCKENNPPSTTAGGALTKLVNISPMATQNAGMVQLPALGVQVKAGTPNSPGANVSGATVVVDANCNTNWLLGPTNGSGQLDDPGVPYSTNTKVCVFATVGGVTKRIILKNSITTGNEWNTMPIVYFGGGDNLNFTYKSNGTAAGCFL